MGRQQRWAIEPRNEYPDDWDAIAERAKAAANYCCEHCGMKFIPGTNKAETARNKDGKPSILTIHHLNGDKADCSFENLLVCCQRCHLKIQGSWGPGDPLPPTWDSAPTWLLARKLAYQTSPQMRMF